MNTADLITSFFNNEMSPDQERQFLLSVASSDSLRLGLKSHVMLDKILYEQSSQSRVPVEVRMNIMKEAAVVAAAGSALAADEALANRRNGEATPSAAERASVGRAQSGARRFFRWSSGALALFAGIGIFFAGFYTGTQNTEDRAVLPAQVQDKGTAISPALSGSNAQVPASSVSVPERKSEAEQRLVTVEPAREEKPSSAPSTEHRRENSNKTVAKGEPAQTASSGTAGKEAVPTADPVQVTQGTSSSAITADPLKIIDTSSPKK